MTASNIVAHPNAALPTQTPAQLSLIRRTVAKDCNDDEFNMFLSYCRALQLDPLRKQIYAFVFSKGNAAKRNMSVIIGIDGFRSIAARTGNYRPGKTTWETDPALKDPASNPAGLVSATVTVHVFSHAAWHEVEATAFWDEHAPMKEDGDFVMVETGEKWPDGNPKKRKQFTGPKRWVLDTDGQWGKMPKLMLAKIAEAQALRRAWPDNFANVYGEEEVARAAVQDADLLPSEAAARGDVEERMARIGGGQTILLDLMDGPTSPLQPVPVGQFADKVCAFIKAHADEPSQIQAFAEKNRFGMREFWALHPGDALDLKKKIEDAVNNPPASDEQGSAA